MRPRNCSNWLWIPSERFHDHIAGIDPSRTFLSKIDRHGLSERFPLEGEQGENLQTAVSHQAAALCLGIAYVRRVCTMATASWT